MELFDLLEARVGDLLRQIDDLREENETLNATARGLAELRDENRILREALLEEQRRREAMAVEVENRIQNLLAQIGAYMGNESAASGAVENDPAARPFEGELPVGAIPAGETPEGMRDESGPAFMADYRDDNV